MSSLTLNRMNKRESSLDPAMVGMIVFLMTEVMFFAGLIVAQSVLWSQGGSGWPPPGQPRLPVSLSLLNTVVLLGSGLCLAESFRQLSWNKTLFRSSLFLGVLFLCVQGYEWVRLLGHGLTAKTSAYGGFFYAIVGSHALHAVGGLCVLLWVESRLRNEEFGESIMNYFVPSLFWFFVVGVWPVLFLTTYGLS
ncbi:MAG: heme-copper oxidase subunit III [bacterium]